MVMIPHDARTPEDTRAPSDISGSTQTCVWWPRAGLAVRLPV